MSADISRVRFDPRNDFNGVVQQQGRVLLDADANEQQEITDRRSRAHAADLGSFGPSPGITGTAVIPRTTPDAFALTITGSALSLGRGRMYVDGLLAENHGSGATAFDRLLGEPFGEEDTPYLSQPYWPHPTALPAAGRHLVYLDVWERELTWVERPDLVDPAIAVDTTARTQVVWQARVHEPDVPGLACDTPDAAISGWEALTAPSAGRLTVGTVAVAAPDNPCSLPPSGDYRGLENQSYRVEIHTGGAPGAATFKWSRDNGSVTVPVTEMSSSSRLRLASLGKDADVLALKPGHWVEILDDDHELDGEPGEMRQITVHPEDQSVSFTPALPAGWPTTTADAVSSHLRVRRWDGAAGAVTVPAGGTAVVLEHGITVTLTAPGGAFRTGDHWIFAARTATTSVDKPVLAPPLGPHHHFARVGIIDAGVVISKRCTPLWPADDVGDDCDCTICVCPDEHASGSPTIQQALDEVAEHGGTVCLCVGTYRLDEPLRISKASGVRLRGHGAATTLLAKSDVLVISGSANVIVSDLTAHSVGDDSAGPTGPSAAAAVRVMSSYEVSLERLTLSVEGQPSSQASGIKLHGLSVSTRIVDNSLAAPVGVNGWVDPDEALFVHGLAVTDNTLKCTTSGVALDGAVTHAGATRLTGNQVLGASVVGLSVTGIRQPEALVQISGNYVSSNGHGIAVSTGGTTVTDNRVILAEGHDFGRKAVGILGDASTPVTFGSTTQISDNIVAGFGHGISVMEAGPGVHITGNEVFETGDGINVVCKAPSAVVHVCDNVVRDVASTELDGRGSVSGVMVAGSGTALCANNTVTRVGREWQSSRPTVGIAVAGTSACRWIGNTVSDVGSRHGGSSIDFLAAGVGHLSMEGNQSLRSDDFGGSADLDATGLLVRDGFGLEFHLMPNRRVAGFSHAGRSYVAGRGIFVAQPGGASSASTIGGNTVTGSQLSQAVDVAFNGTVLLSANHCMRPTETKLPTVRVEADAAAVSGNRVTGGDPSMELVVARDRLTVVGNLVANRIDAIGGLDPRWAPLNLDGVV